MGNLSVLNALGGVAIAFVAIVGAVYGLVRFIIKVSQWLDRVTVGITGTGKRVTDLEAAVTELRSALRDETRQRRAEVRDLMERMRSLEEKVS